MLCFCFRVQCKAEVDQARAMQRQQQIQCERQEAIARVQKAWQSCVVLPSTTPASSGGCSQRSNEPPSPDGSDLPWGSVGYSEVEVDRTGKRRLCVYGNANNALDTQKVRCASLLDWQHWQHWHAV